MDIQALQVFLAAAETENFSAAARRLDLSQPAISFRIQSLETELKVKLFERIGKRVVLTKAGRELLPLAHELIDLSTSIEETVCARRDTVHGLLRIGCGTNLAKPVLPKIIGAFRTRYPLVRIHCEVMSSQVIGDKLAKGEIQFGVVDQPFTRERSTFDLLFADELVLVVPASHSWAARGRVSPAELREQDWILSDVDIDTDSLLSMSLKAQGIALETLHAGMRTGDAESVLAAVEAGQGVAFVSRLAARRSLELEHIKMIQVEEMSLLRCEIYLVYCKKGETPAQARYREFIESTEGQCLIAELLTFEKEG